MYERKQRIKWPSAVPSRTGRARGSLKLISIELDVADHLGPLRCLPAHVVGHLLGRTLQQLGASVDHLLADDRVGDGSNVSLVATSTSPSKSSVAPWGFLKTECRMQRHRPQVSIPEAGASPRSFQYWRENMREASGILASPERLQQSRRTPTESLCGRGDARGEVRRVLRQIHFNCSMTVPSEIVGRPTPYGRLTQPQTRSRLLRARLGNLPARAIHDAAACNCSS